MDAHDILVILMLPAAWLWANVWVLVMSVVMP
jgi:hypothetical protein